MNKRNATILISLILIIGIIITYFFFFQKNKARDIKISEQKLTECLNEDKEVSYRIKEKNSKDGGVISIEIKNRLNNKLIYSFEIKNVRINYYPIELYRCGVYITKMFGYNSAKEGNQYPGYKEEIWKYNYKSEGESLILLAEKPKEFISYYSPDFRIDHNEKYIVLEKGYLGKDDYSLVIKDLDNKEDSFVLSAKSIFEQYPNIIGDFDMLAWTNDGRYFWGDISEGAYVNGYFRIDAQNWKVDIFEAPQDVLGGDALNIESGWITVHPGNEWYGFADMTEEEKEKRRKQGIGTELYIHNLITGEKKFIVKTDEPLWYFKPKWLSDTELEYELPSGEKKIHRIKLNN